MNRYLRVLGDMQRKEFRQRKAFITVDTCAGVVDGTTITCVKAFAVVPTTTGKKTLRIDLLSNDDEKNCDLLINKFIKFLKN